MKGSSTQSVYILCRNHEDVCSCFWTYFLCFSKCAAAPRNISMIFNESAAASEKISMNNCFWNLLKLGSHWAINNDIWRYLLGDHFLTPVWTFLSLNIAKLSLNIVKYRSTPISNIFDKYCQITSRFMTHSIEFQVFSKDATSKVKTQWAK